MIRDHSHILLFMGYKQQLLFYFNVKHNIRFFKLKIQFIILKQRKILQNFFGKSKKGHLFCPFLRYHKTFPKKNGFCDHNLKLSSGRKKNNFHFVTINFQQKWIGLNR